MSRDFKTQLTSSVFVIQAAVRENHGDDLVKPFEFGFRAFGIGYAVGILTLFAFGYLLKAGLGFLIRLQGLL